MHASVWQAELRYSGLRHAQAKRLAKKHLKPKESKVDGCLFRFNVGWPVPYHHLDWVGCLLNISRVWVLNEGSQESSRLHPSKGWIGGGRTSCNLRINERGASCRPAPDSQPDNHCLLRKAGWGQLWTVHRRPAQSSPVTELSISRLAGPGGPIPLLVVTESGFALGPEAVAGWFSACFQTGRGGGEETEWTVRFRPSDRRPSGQLFENLPNPLGRPDGPRQHSR